MLVRQLDTILPDFIQANWGMNYPRLLSAKKAIDSDRVRMADYYLQCTAFHFLGFDEQSPILCWATPVTHCVN